MKSKSIFTALDRFVSFCEETIDKLETEIGDLEDKQNERENEKRGEKIENLQALRDSIEQAKDAADDARSHLEMP